MSFLISTENHHNRSRRSAKCKQLNLVQGFGWLVKQDVVKVGLVTFQDPVVCYKQKAP